MKKGRYFGIIQVLLSRGIGGTSKPGLMKVSISPELHVAVPVYITCLGVKLSQNTL
jgi:hypothetical protein